MPIRAVFFDLDDTLLETHDSHLAALAASCARASELHPEWSSEALQDSFTRTYRRLEADMEAGRTKYDSQSLFRTRNWEETLRECGLPLEVGEELAELYLDRRRAAYRLYDEVPGVLEDLSRDYTLVLVTNGLGDLQRDKYESVGLERWIKRVAISGELSSWKPDSAIFRHALALADVAPGEALMVGDSLERDVAGAQPLGIGTFWVRRYPHLQPLDGITPDHEAPDLGSLRAVIESHA
jgi:putative hydrolase of the HAD superfamily